MLDTSHVIFDGSEDLLAGMVATIAISLCASIAKAAIMGWRGVRAFFADIIVGVFCGILASWVLRHCELPATMDGVLISLAALTGRETLKFFTDRETIIRVLTALREWVLNRLFGHAMSHERGACQHESHYQEPGDYHVNHGQAMQSHGAASQDVAGAYDAPLAQEASVSRRQRRKEKKTRREDLDDVDEIEPP